MINVSVARTAEYYTSLQYESYLSAEGKGTFHGKLAEKLGLSEKEVNKEEIMKYAGEKRVGIDVTVSAPKSVSIAYALAPDEVRKQIKEAYDKAVNSLIKELENYIYTRDRTQNAQSLYTKADALISRFDHFTSRELDPQLHSHLLISNQVYRGDKFTAIEAREIYRVQHYLDTYFKAELAKELSAKGFELEPTRDGFEIKGISREVIENFSKRSNEIEKTLSSLGLDRSSSSAELRESIALSTRDHKKVVDLKELQQKWINELQAKNLSFTIERNKEPQPQLNLDEKLYSVIHKTLEGISALESTVTKEQFLTETIKNLHALGYFNFDVNELKEKVSDYLKKTKQVERLDLNGIKREYVFVEEIKKLEEKLDKLVKEANEKGKSFLSEEKAQRLLDKLEKEGIKLTEDQKNTVYSTLTGQTNLHLWQGVAGAGKTFTLSIVAKQLQEQGYKITALASTGKAAEVLANELKEKGIQANAATIDSFLINTERLFREKEIFDRNAKAQAIVQKHSLLGLKVAREGISYSKDYEVINKKFEKTNFASPRNVFAKHALKLIDKINQLNIPSHLKTEPIQALNKVAKTETYISQLNRFIDKLLQKQTKQAAYVLKDRYQIIVEREKNITHIYTKDTSTGWISHAAFEGKQMIENERFITKSEVEKQVREIGRTVYIIDETGMTGIKNMANFLEKVVPQNGKIITIGDIKQLKPVSAGDPFRLSQEKMDRKELSTIFRQKEASYRELTTALSRQDFVKAITLLEKSQKVVALQQEKLAEKVKEAYFAKGYDKTLIVTPTNQTREFLNEAIRNELVNRGIVQEGEKHIVRENTNLNGTQILRSVNYEKNLILQIMNKEEMKRLGIDVNEKDLRITEINTKENTLTLKGEKKEYKIKAHELNPEKVSVWKEKEISIGKGDRIVALKNDKELNVKNGEVFEVKEIKNNKLVLQNENKLVEVDINKYNYFSHAYAITTHKAQGVTVQNVIYAVPDVKQASFNQVYVGLTRGKQDFLVYVGTKDGSEKSIEKAKIDFYSKLTKEQLKLNVSDLKDLSKLNEKASITKEDIKNLLKSLKTEEKALESKEIAKTSSTEKAFESKEISKTATEKTFESKEVSKSNEVSKSSEISSGKSSSKSSELSESKELSRSR
ncbi:MAG: MobF family relaxase [Brevinematia bacterium]